MLSSTQPLKALVLNQHLNDFQIIPIRQCRKWCGGQCLIPVSDGCDVILQGQITPAAAPAESLDSNAQILLEANRIGDVPAIEAETRLRIVETIGPDNLRQPGVRRSELA